MPTTPSYMDSANLFLSRLAMAERTEEIQSALDKMEDMGKEAPAAKTILGLAYLLDGKPWYNFNKGFQAIQEAAEGEEPFCWFILGSLYLNGKTDIKKDPILAKYWIKKAAEKGYHDAIVILKEQWEDYPEGIVGASSGQKNDKKRREKWIGIGLVILIGIVVLCYVLLGDKWPLF